MDDYPMFARILLTFASLVVALVGVLLADCQLDFSGGLFGDICKTVASYGLNDTVVLGGGLLVFAGLSAVAVWVPTVRPGAKRRRRKVSLRDNLDRLGDVGGEPVATPPDSVRASLVGRLEALEASLGSDVSVHSREATELCMSLLRQANDLHNRGELETDDFKEINTRLLDLLTLPATVG